MIEQYWNEVFGKYRNHQGKFEIPEFPEPMMSAHFGVENIIGSHGSGKNLWLCEFSPVNAQEVSISSENLRNIGDDFWNYQLNFNTQSFSFISRLVPFLNQLKTPHFHLFMKDERGICASVLAGEGKSGVFLFNLLVREDKRGCGLARHMTNEARSFFAGKTCFYWTVHRGFFFDSKVSDYSVNNKHV